MRATRAATTSAVGEVPPPALPARASPAHSAAAATLGVGGGGAVGAAAERPMLRAATEASILVSPRSHPVAVDHATVSAGDIAAPALAPAPDDVLAQEHASEVEWSHFAEQLKEARGLEKQLPELFQIGYDEVRLVREARMYLTTKPSVPADLDRAALDPFAEQCVDTYTMDWPVLANSSFDGGVEKKAPASTRRFTVNAGAMLDDRPMRKCQSSDMMRKEHSSTASSIYGTGGAMEHEADDLSSSLLAPYFAPPDPVSLRAALDESLSRTRIFRGTVAPVAPPYIPTVGANPFASTASGSGRSLQVRLECLEWEMDIPPLEPLFGTLALYNMRTQQRVSETFHFDLNSPEENAQCKVGHFVESKSCVWSMPAADPDVHVVLRVFKVLRGEPEKDAHTYIKAKQLKKRDLERFAKETNDMLQREGCVFQPFVWSECPLFEDGALRSITNIGDLRLFKFQCGDEGIFEQLAKEELKRRVLIPGSLKVEVRRVTPEEPLLGCVTPSLLELFPKGNGESVTRCIEYFGPSASPAVAYVNNLYVYPLSVKTHVANTQVLVALKCDDIDPDEGGIPGSAYCVWGPTQFTSRAATAVTYREKRPQFCDEVKLKLPAVLSPKLHLLFCFYSVPTSGKKESATLVGRAAVPLVSPEGTLLEMGAQTVPIAQSMLPGYLDPAVQTHFKWLDSRKPLFSFSTRLQSSVHSTNAAICALSRALPRFVAPGAEPPADAVSTVQARGGGEWAARLPPEEQVARVEEVAQLSAPLSLKFFPSLCSSLLRLMCVSGEVVAEAAFRALLQLIHTVSAHTNSQSLLVNYVRFVADETPGAPKPLYQVLAALLRKVLESGERSLLDHRHKLNWFPVLVIIKSIALTHAKSCAAPGAFTGPPTERALSPGFVDDMDRVLHLMYSEAETQNLDAMTMFPLLMKDLLSLIDHGIVFRLVYKYLSALNPSNDNLLSVTVKFTFLKIITDHPYYVPLNVPTPFELSDATELDTSALVHSLWKEHFFVGIMLREIRSCLRQKKRIREQSITTLRTLFQSHDADPRYQEMATKTRITSLYFPFILIAIEGAEFIKGDLSAESQMDWLVCLLFVLKNSDRDLVRRMWRSESQERRSTLLSLLVLALDTFKELREMFATVCQATLDLLFDFVVASEGPTPPEIAAHMLEATALLLSNNTRSFLASMYPVLHQLATTLADHLFVGSANIKTCEAICYEMLLDCNCSDSVVRSHATSAFYVLLQVNYTTTGDVSRMKMQSTVAVSRMVGEEKFQACDNLRDGLGQLVAESEKRQQSEGAVPLSSVRNVAEQITNLLMYNQQLANNRHDQHLMADLYLKFAQSYASSPAMRVTWLENLASLHSSNKNWEEAAQTKIMIAVLIAQYLDHHNQLFMDMKAFRLISPNVLSEVPMPKVEMGEEESNVWSIDGLIKYLHEAVLLMKQAKQYEVCIEIYSLLVQAHKSVKNYSKLIDLLTEYRLLTEVLVQTNKDIRILGQYFRVCFYGNALEEQAGKMFIYKCGPRENLMTFQQMLKDILVHKVENEEAIVVLPNKTVDPDKLEPDKVYAQIASVTPYFDASETDRDSAFQRNFNVDKFIFESAIKAKGEAEGDSKKKTIFQTILPFPYAKNRLEVVKTREILLSPIEHAIELIDDRIERFNAELNAPTPRLNSLQQLLQGSVVPMVNEGPLKICATFLSRENSTKYPRHNVTLLRENMARFSKLAGFAIALNKSVIKEEHFQFQEMVEKQYAILKVKIKEFTDIEDDELNWPK